MAEVTAALVKDLRDKTGAGMMDCKNALSESGGDMEAAVDWLRKKGLAAAAKKAGRVAAEGLVGVATGDRSAAVVEVNSETDFVARNDTFQALVGEVARLALASGGTLESVKAAGFPGTGRTVDEEVTHMVASIGENIGLRRVAKLSVATGAVSTYVHSALAPNLGKIGVLVALESSGDTARLEKLGRQIAMHVAAARPEALTTADVDAAAVAREREVLTEQARASGKPDNIIEKMVEGRLKKYYEEVVLTEQVFVVDGENRVGQVIEKASAELGAPIKLAGFVRFQLGEGIDKGDDGDDFAAEVAALRQ